MQAGRGYTPVIELQKPAIAGIVEDAFRCKDHTARGYHQTIQNKQCWSKPLKNNKQRKNWVLVYQNKTDPAVRNRYRNTRPLLVLAGSQARWFTSALRTEPGADLGGGCRGCSPPPEMTCGFLIQLVFCKKTMWFIGVEVEQETSATPPPKKNPGSAPVNHEFRWYKSRDNRGQSMKDSSSFNNEHWSALFNY